MSSIKVPYRISEIDINNICYTDIKVNNKKTIIYLKYNDNNKFKNIVFQTPTFMSTYVPKIKNDIYELDVPLMGKEQNKINKFISFLESIDKKIIKDAKNNNKWFEKFANVKSMKYQRIIREPTDKTNKTGIIRLKLLKTNDFETIIQNTTSRMEIEEINKDCWLRCILELYAIWINENGFGIFVRPVLLNFKPCPKISYNYKLIEDSDDEPAFDVVDTLNNFDNSSIFIRSESEITSSILEMPTNANTSETIDFNNDDINDNQEINSSDEPVNIVNKLSSTTSSDN
jgi:hypothetical protein|uniref:Uncharacterized protein n=1 Tax=viral metagenome TaxID=1070528 RepID=A0A6C0HUY8_9ZZZZ